MKETTRAFETKCHWRDAPPHIPGALREVCVYQCHYRKIVKINYMSPMFLGGLTA